MMKPTKKNKKSNKKKWLLVLVALVIVGLPVSYLGGREVLKMRIRGWREQGIAASKAEQHAAAADLLVRYLQRRPEDVEALSYYIKSREAAELPNGQHLAATIDALKMILSQDPDRLKDRRHLMDLYAKLEHRPEAIDTANTLLKSTDPENKNKK